MIDSNALPSFAEIRRRTGLPALDRHGRGACIACESSRGFSESEAKGLWHCFSCGDGGDKIEFLQRVLSSDFRGVLSWLGLDTAINGAAWRPDPELLRKRQEQLALEDRVRTYGRDLRDQYRDREDIRSYALERLAGDAEDDLAWWLLSVAYTWGPPLDVLEQQLDSIDLARTPEQLSAADSDIRGIVA